LAQKVALQGETASGLPSGVAYGNFGGGALDLNNSGQVSFWSRLNNPTVRSGYFLWSKGDIEATARLIEGQALPGGGTAGFLASGGFGTGMSLTDFGEVAYQNFTSSTAPTDNWFYAIADKSGTLRRFAFQGDRPKSIGGVFSSFYSPIVASSDGKFFTSLILNDGPVNFGVFVDSGAGY